MKGTIKKISRSLIGILLGVGMLVISPMDVLALSTAETGASDQVEQQVAAEAENTTAETAAVETTVAETIPPAAEISHAEKSVAISSSQGAVIQENETITLTAVLSGFEGLNVKLQWQYNDGQGWKDAEGGNELLYQFQADEISLKYEWRLKVNLA